MMMLVIYDDVGQVDAVPAADVTWWLEGEQIESRDEFLLGDNESFVMVVFNDDAGFR